MANSSTCASILISSSFSVIIQCCCSCGDVIPLDTKPQTLSLPTTRKRTCVGRALQTTTAQDYGLLTKPVRLSAQTGETSPADRFGSSPPTSVSPV